MLALILGHMCKPCDDLLLHQNEAQDTVDQERNDPGWGCRSYLSVFTSKETSAARCLLQEDV